MRELITSYPYIIRYRIDRDEVVILRIWHTSRRRPIPDGRKMGCACRFCFARPRHHGPRRGRSRNETCLWNAQQAPRTALAVR